MVQKLVSFILMCLGVAVIAGGIASATLFKPDSQVSATTPAMADSPYAVVHAPVLALVDDNVTIKATAPGGSEMALILGRTVDIEGWLAGQDYYSVTGLADWETLITRKIVAEDEGAATEEPADDAAGEDEEAVEEETVGASNSLEQTESDMWISYAAGPGTQEITLENVDHNVSLLAVTTSANLAAPTIEAQWVRDVRTPLLVPGIVIGAVLILVGAAVLILALRGGPNKNKQSALTQGADESSEPVTGAWAGDSLSAPQREPAAASIPFAPATPVPPVKPLTRKPMFEASGQQQEQSSQSSQSSQSAPSVASAATVARALAAEPDLNTGELQQLGLTRRQLRELHQAQAARNSSPTTIPAPNPAAMPANDDESQPAAQSRATASNWRAAWGVGSAAEQNSPAEQSTSQFQPVAQVAHRSPSYGPGQAQRNLSYPAATPAAPSPQAAPNGAEPRVRAEERDSHQNAAAPVRPQVQGTVPQTSTAAVPPAAGRSAQSAGESTAATERDVRQPASWWGSEENAQESTRRPRYSSAPSAQTSASSLSAAEALSAQSAASGAARAANRSEAPATRRALYSSYRAEAERLSAQEDWPVDAPATDNETRSTEGAQ